jgi:hypothetical protein
MFEVRRSALKKYNPKSQAPSCKQAPSPYEPMTKTRARSCIANGIRLGHWNLEVGICLEFGIWYLEFEFYKRVA